MMMMLIMMMPNIQPQPRLESPTPIREKKSYQWSPVLQAYDTTEPWPDIEVPTVTDLMRTVLGTKDFILSLVLVPDG